MDNNDLEPHLLQKLLMEPENCKENIIKQVIQWNSDLQPSIGTTKKKINNFLLDIQHSQRLYKSAQQSLQIIKNLYKGKCPRNFIRAYLQILKDNIKQIDKYLDYKSIKQQWKHISIDILHYYIDTFNLSAIITDQQYNQKFFQLLESKNYQHCLQFIKLTGCKKNHINALLSKMTTNKQASKAADYIKQLQLDPKQYPQIQQRLYKSTARHFLAHNGWQYAEQIFQQYPQTLASIVQDLVYKKKFNEAFSIIYRHPIKQYIKKQQAVQFVNTNQQLEILQNKLHVDRFGPSNLDKFLSLEQFQIHENDVIWVHKNLDNLKIILKQISSASLIGIDTQSIVGLTKLQKNFDNSIALIQIAANNKVYVFDAFDIDCPLIKQCLLKIFQDDTFIIGHSLTNDIDCLFKSLQLQKKQTNSNNKFLDIWNVFKKLFPKQKYSSLAFICQKLMGKPLCKQQTLTNWRRRPLRRNQLHYAALDALIVVKIYQKLYGQYGQIVHEYGDLQNNQL